MGVPKITFTMKTAAEETVSRLKNGVVGLVVRDSAATAGLYSVAEENDLPEKLSATNRAYVLQALVGSRGTKPTQVRLAVIGAEDDLSERGLAQFAATDVDYLALMPEAESADYKKAITWLKTARGGHFVGKLVAAHEAADDMAVVNFCTDGIVSGGVTYTANQYCARVAGILAATGLSSSATYVPLEEVDAVGVTEDADAAVERGELILLHDGRKAKIARAVNSLTTTSGNAGLQKIKVVEGVDLIRSYARALVEDRYLGQKANSYDNKQALVAEVQAYLLELESAGVLAAGSAAAELDYSAQRAYLQNAGTDVSAMSEQEILEADTGSWVFLALSGVMQDAMEDFATTLTMGG